MAKILAAFSFNLAAGAKTRLILVNVRPQRWI